MSKSRTPWPEIAFGGGSASSRISRAVARGELRRLGPALYTADLSSPPEQIVARHRWQIVAHYVPASVVTHRTAFQGTPSADGTVFLTGPVTKRLDLPGLKLRVTKGPGALPGDQPFMSGLTISSEPRLLLENLGIARARGGPRRTVTATEVEARLESILRSRGEFALNQIRDEARMLVPALRADHAMTRLDAMIGALLRSRPAATLATAEGRARASGLPFDPERVERFELLARSLGTLTPPIRADDSRSGPAFDNLAFFDAYFSNYIEGTEFQVDEARAIVFDGTIPLARPADAHDILGTWQLVGDPSWLDHSIMADQNAVGFLDRLRHAHAVLMAARPEAGPGHWKTRPNQAGATRFVEPELTEGTLIKGWETARTGRTALQRAVMLMFVVAEVHPFSDGNGRIARACMSAEFFSAHERRIIMPTVFRDDYLGGLRALSRHDNPAPFLLMLNEAQRFTAWVRWDSYDGAIEDLNRARAFEIPEPGIRLRIPRTAP